ncbi:PEP-utilizing enzyme [Streptomyces sp. NBC_00243]|uniref:PEP/pyruvate-binding domain-containing protein n=1 Tax=Streptomyces sp. NBC_00243 TaxID=2975688 RepID=UPI002DD88931|nr:PEP/pyruvate-binding domain-containing protein [Streptomyces sp. NBC_00243]WRZ23345.1 PEP-utilizing enzyme [Streptomyces sp. NBC_00243]
MTTLDERHEDGARDGEELRGGSARAARGLDAVPLDQPTAALPEFAGSKAAHLARAARAGLPVLPGFVVPYEASDISGTSGTSGTSGIPWTSGDLAALRHAWHELSGGGARPLVVRSSSPQEDTQESSLAGQFASVLDVRGWRDFRTAIRTVLDSAQRPDGSTAPMAVLLQPMLRARVGGVLFGADPVEGRADRMLVSAVRGGPDTLVSGEQPGTNYSLNRWGRALRTEPPSGTSPEDEPPLTSAQLRRLARLARRARRVFGGPQDIEFGFDGDGRLWLFQSRPITAMAARPARRARLLGPGPVAETLPGQLEPLEEDLWLAPMARGLAAALDIGGSAPRRKLRAVPVVTAVGGRAAADLRLLGVVPAIHRRLAFLNPAPGARRLGAAWRVGRLTVALPGLAMDLVADVDRRLSETPRPAELPGPALVAALRWTRTTLVSLHAQEALAGALLPENRTTTAAGTALVALAESRAQGVPDTRIVAAEPVVLALVAPSLRGELRLPGGLEDQTGTRQVLGNETGTRQVLRDDTRPGPGDEALRRPAEEAGRSDRAPNSPPYSASPTIVATLRRTSPDPLPPREALRLRIRWVQELQVRLVREGALRLTVRGGLSDAGRVGLLRWEEFVAALEGSRLPGDVEERLPRSVSAPLPDAFRLADGGVVVAERRRTGGGARGVAGGRAAGTAWDGIGPRPPDAVLVVRTLDPALAPLLPGLAGLVAQTGSPLSHLAVLAREFGLPTVVGADDAVHRFRPGSRLTVDGTTGDVHLMTGQVSGAAR